ncbi:phosphoribosylformylglycinamidine synthase, purL [Deinococcus grandis]|uniref:Phosphoribosylformylglycinamidine synthase, purL n=1 Tax=Deinococcus grandis TaxID=57498 RepID=A0A100HL11_9DEIO|nr:hypothetical protein DEGR_05170 [Deinococcus grandis]GAQ22708.1 phosphoribosylformylglycinamidine synthase, purL [Deinococcus grandis]
MPLHGGYVTQGRDLLLHHGAGTRQVGLLLPLERGGAQDGPGGLTLRADGRAQEPLQRRSRALRSSLG